MNKLILNAGVQDYISKNLDTDIMSVLLKKSLFEGVPARELAEQIEAKKKCEYKLPLWFQTPRIYFPNKLHIEQASSETTARYKAALVHGKTLLDLTGGFGADTYYFAQAIERVTSSEINKELWEIAVHNFQVLGATNISAHNTDGIGFLKSAGKRYDWIYVDPSRRNESRQKVFRLSDCFPEVPVHLDLLFSHSDHILIKAAPLLDISIGLRELESVRELHVVAVNNEVKELLWVLERGYTGEVTVKTIDLRKGGQAAFNFNLPEESNAKSKFATPLRSHYLYEPNASILKSGAFKLVGQRFSFHKLHEHSHLYSSEHVVEFPGRVFKIVQILPFTHKTMQQFLYQKANITTRNFPHSVAEIRKKYNIADGGSEYLFFTKDPDGRLVVLRCQKVAEPFF